ncbi:ABC transporter ATP-binding protein [Actinopolymorpha rutila]|uniref:Molybdate transport system ATP-binding protein n=1 Tax=Actinopolymorpha rutila TaxID=446787 RepID=A0A852ZA07_9ACTN|nr:ABC transporter ATP-binding protein [Actinopolymorpha rutila]NYH88588.1 molybdate transport system ATP-binding protein [Actinopolymorpha rutila]
MSLRAHVVVRRPTFTLDLELVAGPGEVVALLGPNGAGKSTTLRALAGLKPLTAGEIHLDERVLDRPATRDYLRVEQRPIGVVFQDYLLFPHLSALDNVAFGPRAHGVPKAPARAAALSWLERVGLAHVADARPRALSGGQAQRVALARALAVKPRLLLLDEPLAALDASTRVDVRADLRRHLSAYDGTCVLVTHEPLDAMVLADRLVVLENGRVTQHGSPAEVARTPRTEYVARLVGLNLFRGHTDAAGVVRLADGGELTAGTRATGEVFVAFAPSAVALYRSAPGGSPRNCWQVDVAGVERHGDLMRVSLTGRPPVLADVTADAVADLGLEPGARVWASVKAAEIRCYPA